jgi:hypothetical protein
MVSPKEGARNVLAQVEELVDDGLRIGPPVDVVPYEQKVIVR